MSHEVLIAGASGLVGSHLLQLLVADETIDVVHALVRKPLGVEHPRLREHVVDFDALEAAPWPPVSAVFCCLGTTIKKAGSQPAFEKVDYEYVKNLAQSAARHEVASFGLVTAMGASVKSGIFYNRVKGKAEAAVRNAGIASVTIARPSFIVGERTEARAGESTALTLMRVFAPVIPRKYRPIPARAVALALLEGARAAVSGVTIVESDRLQDLVR